MTYGFYIGDHFGSCSHAITILWYFSHYLPSLWRCLAYTDQIFSIIRTLCLAAKTDASQYIGAPQWKSPGWNQTMTGNFSSGTEPTINKQNTYVRSTYCINFTFGSHKWPTNQPIRSLEIINTRLLNLLLNVLYDNARRDRSYHSLKKRWIEDKKKLESSDFVQCIKL